jgi:hypothetical protein
MLSEQGAQRPKKIEIRREKMKRSTVKFLLLAGVLAATGKVWAASDTLQLTVTPTGTRIAQITAGVDAYDFGNVAVGVGQSTISASGTTVSNIGTFPAKFQLQITSPDGTWLDNDTATGPAADHYVLQGLFNSAQPAPTDFAANDDVRSGSANTAGGLGGALSGDQDASSVLSGASRTLWFQMKMPTSTSVTSQRSFTVSIDAVP